MTPAEPRIVGNYRLLALIGSGGTSQVYAAAHTVLGEPAAVKLLRAELAGQVSELFVTEATRTRAISHPNVVRVLECGRDAATGCFYLAMEQLDGGTLAARLEREGPLDEAEVRRLGIALAEGMAAVHAAGVVHRDLKPANVLLTAAGAPKIADFGIAKHLDGGSAVTTSRRVGTPAYMAPEQLTGGLISPAVDVWALGVILFEAATGRLPFAVTGGSCPQLVEDAPRAGVDPALDHTIARFLVRDPGRRVAAMTDVIRLLREPPADRITEDAGPLTPPPSRPGAARRAWWLAAAVAAAATVGVAAALALPRSDDALADVAPAAPAAPPPARSPDPAPVRPVPPDAATPMSQPDPEVLAPAQRVTYIIDVRSRPAGATVLVDGNARGKTPVRLHVRPRAQLELRLARYRTETRRVERGGSIVVQLREGLD